MLFMLFCDVIQLVRIDSFIFSIVFCLYPLFIIRVVQRKTGKKERRKKEECTVFISLVKLYINCMTNTLKLKVK